MLASKRRTTLLLGYSGLLPFVGITLAVITGISNAIDLFVLYSLSILAFMAGGAWGAIQQLSVSVKGPSDIEQSDNEQSSGLQSAILAYLIALLGVLLPLQIGLALLVLAFLMVIIVEQKRGLFAGYSASYRQMRWILTTVVIACHVIIWVGLYF